MSLLHSGSTASDSKLYPEDVFSTYLYTGNGSTQTINNGIDLATYGGLTWLKSRNVASQNYVINTARIDKYLLTNTTGAEGTGISSLLSFTSSGFNLTGNSDFNTNSQTYASWTFRRAPKFFDCGTFTYTNGNNTYPHSLSNDVGMLIIKRTDSATGGSWWVWHRTLGNSKYLVLNSTNAETTYSNWLSTTSTNFTLANAFLVDGGSYVWYAFAHDPSADGIIQCGSFTTTTSGNYRTELGFESQFLLVKRSAGGVSSWWMLDTMRGFNVGGNDSYLEANSANAEVGNLDWGSVDATGFTLNSLSASSTYIYLAIRRPNKVPTSGTEVYNAIARTGTGAVATVTGVGFAPDLVLSKDRGNLTVSWTAWYDKIRGKNLALFSNKTDAESSDISGLLEFAMDGVGVGTDANWERINSLGKNYINHFFKRAKGFFDIVCYTGTGVARTVNHNLGVVPELMIVKSRNNNTSWMAYSATLGASDWGTLSTDPFYPSGMGYWNNTAPTSSVFTVGTSDATNYSGYTYVAYLFATLQGISKVGSYTGNGSSQTINCGFTTGARFILIKRTDSTGDWYIWDTARGIVAANDPHLSLNTTAAEVTTDDSIDPESSGFIVNQNIATNINVLNGTYIFLAIA